MYEAIRDFGAPLMDLTSESLSYPSVVFQNWCCSLSRPDILTAISGDIDFDDAYQTALQLELDGVKLRVPSIDVLIKNKESTGREKDLPDVKALKKQYRERRLWPANNPPQRVDSPFPGHAEDFAESFQAWPRQLIRNQPVRHASSMDEMCFQ